MSDDGQNMWDFQPDIAVTNVTWYVMLLEICLKIIKDIYIYIHLQMTYIYIMIYIYIYICVCVCVQKSTFLQMTICFMQCPEMWDLNL